MKQHHGPQQGTSHRALVISAWLTGIYFFIELGLGIYSGSIAVLSDAFHTFSAVGGILLAIIAARIATRPATEKKSFGGLRAEIVGALFNGFFLLFMAVFILWMGWSRLQNPIDLPTLPMFIAAFGGLVIELISLRLLYRQQKGNINIKGAYWHILQTFVGSIIIIVVAVVIMFGGSPIIDPILGMLFGLTLLWASWGIIRDTINILLESVPSDVNLGDIKKDIESLEYVKDVHHIHAWQLTSGKNIFSSHITVTDMKYADRTLRSVNVLLKEKYHFYFSTVQVEDKRHDLEGSEHIDIS